MDQAWIFRDCHLHGHHWCAHLLPKLWVFVTPPPQTYTQRIAAEEIFVHEKTCRQRQDSLEGITHSCLLRQKMDSEYSRRDQLCLWVAEAEGRVVSEFSSFLFQSFSLEGFQSVRLNGKIDIIPLNLLILQMGEVGLRKVEWSAQVTQMLTEKAPAQLLAPPVVLEVAAPVLVLLIKPHCVSRK